MEACKISNLTTLIPYPNSFLIIHFQNLPTPSQCIPSLLLFCSFYFYSLGSSVLNGKIYVLKTQRCAWSTHLQNTSALLHRLPMFKRLNQRAGSLNGNQKNCVRCVPHHFSTFCLIETNHDSTCLRMAFPHNIPYPTHHKPQLKCYLLLGIFFWLPLLSKPKNSLPFMNFVH